MAPRANWKGFLRLSLVTCPVALYPATSDSEKISFNQINRKTGHRIKYAKVDADILTLRVWLLPRKVAWCDQTADLGSKTVAPTICGERLKAAYSACGSSASICINSMRLIPRSE